MHREDRRRRASGIPVVTSIDRNMAVTFSVVVLLLMLVVALVGSAFHQHVSEQSGDELQGIIAGLLADSVSRVSFSGKYHARLLVEQIAESQPRIAYIVVSGLKNEIVAHSNPARNDQALDGAFVEIAQRIVSGEDSYMRRYDDGEITVKEIAIPYRSGYLDKVSGVIFVGVYTQHMKEALDRTRTQINALIAFLTVVSLVVTYFLSRRIAAPVKRMALEFTGILEHAPLLISIAGRDTGPRECSAAYAATLRRGEDVLTPELSSVFANDGGASSGVRRGVGDAEQSFVLTSFPIEQGRRGKTELACCIALDITELENARRELRASEERLALAIEGAELGTWDWNIPSGRLTINTRWAEMLGYAPEEIAPHISSWERLVHPDDLERVLKVLADHHEHGDEYNPELRMRAKSGEWVWVQTSGKVTERNSDGKPLRMLGVHQDISDRRQAQEAMRASESLFRAAFDHAHQSSGVLKPDGTVLRANSTARAMAGVEEADFVGLPFWDAPWWAHSPWQQDRAREAVRKAAQGEFARFEATYPLADGRTAYIDFSLSPVKDDEGRVIYLLPEGHDITERKEREEELRRLRSLLRNVIDSMPSVLVGVDLEGRITQWNRGAEEITGRSEAEARGQALSDVFPELAVEMERAWETILGEDPRRKEKIALSVAGEPRFLDVTVYPLVADGVEGAVIRVDDVTERTHIEEMMIQSEKMLSLGGLAAGMAHEINNPLAGILQNVQVMRGRLSGKLQRNDLAAETCGTTMEVIREYMADRGILEMLDLVDDSGRRAAAIVENMLSFSRKAQGGFVPADVRELLDRTVELAENDYDLKKEYDFRRIRIVREYDSDVSAVPCEASKLQQVFLNILNNGARSMAGSEEPTFVLRVKSEADSVRIELQDNGTGMDEATRRHVFEPFFTTRDVGMGTGLGLSVSYFIITETHGGTMTVESERGEGARFVISLPTNRECADLET